MYYLAINTKTTKNIPGDYGQPLKFSATLGNFNDFEKQFTFALYPYFESIHGDPKELSNLDNEIKSISGYLNNSDVVAPNNFVARFLMWYKMAFKNFGIDGSDIINRYDRTLMNKPNVSIVLVGYNIECKIISTLSQYIPGWDNRILNQFSNNCLDIKHLFFNPSNKKMPTFEQCCQIAHVKQEEKQKSEVVSELLEFKFN